MFAGHESYDSLSAKQVEEEFSRLVEEAFRVNAEEDGLPSEPVQYKTAEMADAMLGSEFHSNYRVPRLSVISEGNTDEYSTESEEGTCDAMSEGLECQAPEGLLTLEKFYLEVQEEENAPILDVLPETEESNTTESMKTPKVNCEERNITGINTFTLRMLNVSQSLLILEGDPVWYPCHFLPFLLKIPVCIINPCKSPPVPKLQDLMEFLNPNSSECTLVLFYTPWCHFSAGLAPHFNCLPRAFPTIHFLALDASQHSSLSTRFGTVAVPNILLFQGAKPMARFNHTERTLETLKAFIFNQSGIEANKDVVITAEDQEGPLPSTPSKGIDWLLVFSLLFVGSFIMYATLRTESIRWLLPGPDQEHPEG